MRKGKFTAEQDAHLNGYIPELLQKLDNGVRGADLTRWKQSTATKALGTSAFADLDVSTISRPEWFKVNPSLSPLPFACLLIEATYR